jgi:signal transduction histidine kinase
VRSDLRGQSKSWPEVPRLELLDGRVCGGLASEPAAGIVWPERTTLLGGCKARPGHVLGPHVVYNQVSLTLWGGVRVAGHGAQQSDGNRLTTTTPRRTVRYLRVVLGLAVAACVCFLVPTVAHAQTPPPSNPPDLGLPPATTRAPEPAASSPTGGGSGGVVGDTSQDSGESDGGSFGITEPTTLVGALALALGLAFAVVAALCLRRSRRRQRGLVEQLRRMRRDNRVAAKVGEADQQKSEFLELVSRELRTPLTAVKGFVDTVRLQWDRLPEVRRRDLVARAYMNAEEMNRLAGQLHDFSRLDDERATMTRQPIQVSEAVEGTLDDLGPLLAEHHVYVEVPDGLAILADATAFGDVLTNLVTNAAKFSPAGRRIIVSATLVDGSVDMSISDEGRGIPREEQERIFDPFYQSPSNEESLGGTGVGLTIAKRFTEMQGGQIAVVSEPGLGSTFWLTMPAAAGPVRKGDDRHHEIAL